MVRVALRAVAPVFAAALQLTGAVPLPLGVAVSQAALLATFQEHPAVVLTVKLPVPPVAAGEAPLEVSE